MSWDLESLPREVLLHILELLDSSHPPSLVAFATSSHNSYAIASHFLFKTIKLIYEDNQQLVQEVQRWQQLLRCNRGLSHVRRLILCDHDVDGPQSRMRRDHGLPSSCYVSLRRCERYDDVLELETSWDLYRSWFGPDDTTISEDDWRVVGYLITQLPSLTDVLYAYDAQFPSFLWECLVDKGCRLHHYTFDDQPLVTRETLLPCLYSIGQRYTARRSQDTVRRLLSQRQRIATLRRSFVCLFADSLDDGSADSVNDSSDLGSALQSLQIDRSNKAFDSFPPFSIPFSVVSQKTFGDFSALRALKLNVPVEHELLPAPDQFPSLVTLSFACMTSPASPGYWEVVGTFLRHLPRLTTLGLRNWKRSVSVIPLLRPELRILDLTTHLVRCQDPLRNDHILAIAEVCPYLEELTIETRRSRGDASEIALYRALGRLPRLQNLCLKLDASPTPFISVVDADGSIRQDTAVEPWFDDWDTQYIRQGLNPHRRGHIRDVFANSAIDSALARSIFEVVDTAKKTIKGRGPVIPLESVTVSAFGGMEFAQRGHMIPPTVKLRPFLTAVDRKWLVQREVRDDARDTLHVRELDQELRQERMAGMLERISVYKEVTDGILEIWKRTWSTSEQEGSRATAPVHRRSARIAARSSGAVAQPVLEPGRPPVEDAWWDDWSSWPLTLES